MTAPATRPPIYTVQLQRNRRLVRQSIAYELPTSALRCYHRLLRQCGHDGMALVLRDGQEITPRQLRDAASTTSQAHRRSPRHDPR